MRVTKLVASSAAVVAVALVAAAACEAQQATSLPAGAEDAVARINASPRHGEWVTVKTGDQDSVRAWLVYPERRTNAPVVVVIHEIFGLSNWVRAVADQLAADGFIAIAPDLLTMHALPTTPAGEPDGARARAVIGNSADPQHHRRARMVAEYAMNLPAAVKKYGIVGYCWGGGFVWQHALLYPDLGAAVSYYGSTADEKQYASLKGNTPVLGLYGSEDQRVNATIARADSAMKSLGKTYEHHVFEGARHGFLRAQDHPANLEATKQAWPLTVAWFRKYVK